MLIITVFRYLKHLFIERKPVKIDLHAPWKFFSSPSVYFARCKLWMDTIEHIAFGIFRLDKPNVYFKLSFVHVFVITFVGRNL